MKKDKVSIIMGSQSDWKTLQPAENILNDFNVEMAKKPFSVQSIESRNNFNFNKSSSLNTERSELIDRYLND